MKKTKYMIQTGLAIAVACLMTDATLRADAEADHNSLRQLKSSYEEAVNSGDLDKLAPYLSNDFTAVLATGDNIKGLDQLKQAWQKIRASLGPGGTYNGQMEPDRSDLFGDIAITHGKVHETVRLSSGKELNFQTTWTAVLHKENGQWKVVRAQATMNPFENQVVEMIYKKTQWTFGLGGLALGLIAGFFANYIRRRSA
jgi:ketosteroid isomerase-like protein